jgi:hypothetical protein
MLPRSSSSSSSSSSSILVNTFELVYYSRTIYNEALFSNGSRRCVFFHCSCNITNWTQIFLKNNSLETASIWEESLPLLGRHKLTWLWQGAVTDRRTDPCVVCQCHIVASYQQCDGFLLTNIDGTSFFSSFSHCYSPINSNGIFLNKATIMAER